MATNAIYRMTSGISQPMLTAKSPRISPPTTERELDSISGVLSDAMRSPSMINSTRNSCAIMGMRPISVGKMKESQPGIADGFFRSRYHSGVRNSVSQKIICRRIRI